MRPVALSSAGGQYVEYLQREMAERAYWEGIGAKLLGLADTQVMAHQAEALAHGIDPETGAQLRNRVQHIGAYDLIVRAPKAASIAAVLDERVEQAHKECVAVIRQRVEAMATVHTRVDGEDRHHETRNLIQAAYHHRSTRTLDPDQHTHLLTLNMTYYPNAGEWRALAAQPMYQEKFTIAEDYRYQLAEKLQGWGYELESRLVDAQRYPRDGRQYPDEVGFRVKGIDPEVEAKLSERTNQIAGAREDYRERNGRYPSEKWTDGYARETRDAKQVPPREELREIQMQKLAPREREQLYRVREEALERAERQKIGMPEDRSNYERAQRVEEWTYGEQGYRNPRMRL